MQLNVSGIPDNFDDNELIELFSKLGKAELAKVIRDIPSGKSRGFGIVRMPNDIEVADAIKSLNGFKIGDSQIKVSRMHETLPGEMEFREWLRDNAFEVLTNIGVRSNQTVLDFGCGPGIFSIVSSGIVGNQGKIYALDIRSIALEHFKLEADSKRLNNIEPILLSRSEVPDSIKDGSIDVILLYDVLQEISDRCNLMKELNRILKQDGVLSIFPMHLGTDTLAEIMKDFGLFVFRDRLGVPGFESASEIINFMKCTS